MRAPRTFELAVDEPRGARLLRARPQFVGGNQARGGGFDEVELRLRQKAPRLRDRLRRARRRGLRDVMRVLRSRRVGIHRDRHAGGTQRRHFLQKVAPTGGLLIHAGLLAN